MALVVALGAVAACRPVGVIGDSITRLAADAVVQELGDDWTATIAAENGQRIVDMLDELDAMVHQDEPPDAIVLNLGTNDVLQENPAWREAFDDAMGLLAGIACVNLVTVNTQTDEHFGETDVTADGINAAIRAAAAADPERVFVIEWDVDWMGEVARQDPTEPHYFTVLVENPASPWYGMYIGDGVHQSPEGSTALARLYRQALDQNCP